MNIDCRNRHPNSDSKDVPTMTSVPLPILRNYNTLYLCVYVYVHIFYSFRYKRKSNLQAFFFFNGRQALRRYSLSIGIMCLQNTRIKSIVHITNIKIIII